MGNHGTKPNNFDLMSDGFLRRYADGRLMPKWRVDQAKRRQSRITWTLLRAAAMLALIFAALLLLARAVGAQTIQTNQSQTLEWKYVNPPEILRWNPPEFNTFTFSETAADTIRVCVGVKPELKHGAAVCYTLGELRGLKEPK